MWRCRVAQFTRVAFEYSTDGVKYAPLGQCHGDRQQLDPDRFEFADWPEHFRSRARLLSQRGLQRLGKRHGISAECFPAAGPGANTNSDTDGDSYTPTLRHSDSNAESVSDGNPLDANFSPHANTHPNSHSHINPHVHPDVHRNSNSRLNPHIHPDADPCDTNPHTATAARGILGNISTRLRVETGDNVLIGGFIITGMQPKRIIVRAIGPSLAPLFPAVLADPILELRNSSGSLIAVNDNWRNDQETEIIATTIPPSNDLESAIVATLPANGSAYTTIVRGVDNGTGIGVVEAYDLDQTTDSKLANISTRGLVQTGRRCLNWWIDCAGAKPIAGDRARARPIAAGAGALGDPTLDLHDGNGALIAGNDNWRTDQEAEIIATTGPPSSDLESAIVRNLEPRQLHRHCPWCG